MKMNTNLTLLFLSLLGRNQGVLAQEPVGGARVSQLEDRSQQQQCQSLDSKDCRNDDYFAQRTPYGDLIPEDEEDPMLQQMPTVDFKAYRRADISSMYQEPPGSRTEATPRFNGQAGKFVNMSPDNLDLTYDNGSGPPGSLIGHAGPFESTGTSTYPTHVFHYIKPDTKEVICTMKVKKGSSIYYCDPFDAETTGDDPSAGVLSNPPRSLDELSDRERTLYDAAKFNREFAPLYREFTGGSEWFGNFPTESPRHKMWRADYFGQEH
eukprot:scaffold12450_cov95-Cylindrotheca_fusiformis.AAC.2